MQRVYKTNDEQFPVGVDFVYRLPEGDTLSSATATATQGVTNVSSTFLVSTTAVISDTVALAVLKASGGTTGLSYRVDFLGTTAGGYKLKGSLEVCVVAETELE